MNWRPNFPVLLAVMFMFMFGLAVAPDAPAAQAKLIKVLPQYLDKKGRHALSPSLYERDAYQAYLRKHPNERMGLRLAVQWKAKEAAQGNLKMRAELRGALGNDLHTLTLEQPVKKSGWFGHWADLRITGEQYEKFGELVAWRVTLLEDDHPLAQQESFLWSGVPTGN